MPRKGGFNKTLGDSAMWKSKGRGHWQLKQDGIFAILSETKEWVTVKDRNIPDVNDVADPELLADGIPRLRDQYFEALRKHEQWVRQGWWPNKVQQVMYVLVVIYTDGQGKEHGFNGNIHETDPRKAMKIADDAIARIQNRKMPSWMKRSSADKIPGGLADKKLPKDFDAKQLAKGIKVEMEHTDDKDLAREIAMDHLTEIPDYYDRLEVMEKNASLENQLVKLGSTNPELRPHIRPVLGALKVGSYLGDWVTLVISGTSVSGKFVKETDKAVQFQNASGSPDNDGRTCWLPKSALKPNTQYSYGQMKAWTVAPWLVGRLDRNQKRALDLLGS